tara:strand:+ start:1986 stop:2960 length:975 start_codon:yes stop_codon:yes gene_type:complete
MISIIVPNFNKDNYIVQTINSVVNQSFSDWELIIVDDQSTDNSWGIISDFVDNNKIFAFKPEVKLYGSGCRNYGLKKSKGEFVIFLDSDDILTDNCLNVRFNHFNNSKSSGFLVFPAGTFNKEIGDRNNIWIPEKGNHLKCFLQHNLQWTISSVIWKRTTLLKLHGFDESFMRLQDVELHTRALLLKNINYKIFSDCKPDFFYRIDDLRTKTSKKIQLVIQLQSVKNYILKTSEFLTSKPEYKKYLRGTLFTFITDLCHNYVIGKISKTDFEDLVAKVFENPKLKTLLGNDCQKYLDYYISLYKVGLFKIKGFNYISKKIFICK